MNERLNSFEALVLHAWWRSRPRRERLRSTSAALLFGLLVAFIFAEGLLRAVPLPPNLNSFLFSCYSPGSPARYMYAYVPELDTEIHVPHLQTTCAFQALRWSHRSDVYGFRNPKDWDQVDVVLLGDSMIYGHGVEENQTVAHFLRIALNVRVANLGRTAATTHDYLALFQNFGLPLRPKVAVVFVYDNDLLDISDTLDEPTRRAFIDHGIAKQTAVAPREHLLRTARRRGTWADRALDTSVVYRAARYALEHATWKGSLLSDARAAEPPDEPSPEPSPDAPIAVDDTLAQSTRILQELWPDSVQHMHRSLELMASAAKKDDTRLVLAYLPGWVAPTDLANDHLPGLLEHWASELGVDFFDATDALMDDEKHRPGTRIPIDGHLTEEGHRWLAEATAAYLREHDLPGPH